MELSGLDKVWVGSSLALTSLFYYLYRKQRSAVRRIQAAPRLQVSADLRTFMETTREISYVALEGRVEAVGKAISSDNHPHLQAVIQKHLMVEHCLIQSSLTGSWNEYVRIVYERFKEIPFQLCPLEGNEASVLVCDRQTASGLTLQIVHEQFHAANLALCELIEHYFRGLRPTGFLETEAILPVGTILTGLGKLTMNNKGEITLEPPENGSGYILSLSGYEDILHQQESLAHILRGAALLFGALGTLVVCIVMYRAYQKYKKKHRRQNHLDEQQLQVQNSEEEQVDAERLCVICIARTRECVILPCGHVCCCFFCYQVLPNHRCPICRGYILTVVPLYQA